MPVPDAIISVIRQWLIKSDNDLKTAELAIKAGADCPTDAACFHAQQCAEKCLKALLIKLGVEFPFTHEKIQQSVCTYESKAFSILADHLLIDHGIFTDTHIPACQPLLRSYLFRYISHLIVLRSSDNSISTFSFIRHQTPPQRTTSQVI